jgi:hypothetical protein
MKTVTDSVVAAASGPAAVLHQALDDLIEGFGDDDSAARLAQVRRDFDDRRGRVFEDEELWEPWTQAFLEWFVLERADGELSPAAAALVDCRDPDRAAALRALCTSHRSLFEIRALRPGSVDLEDLLGGTLFRVAEPRALHGVSVGDVAELRLVGFRDAVWFGRTFCYHPAGTRAAIESHARRIRASGGERREVIDFVASLRIKCERYRHVSPVKVYQSAGQGADAIGRGASG